jgi:hypothetical protein
MTGPGQLLLRVIALAGLIVVGVAATARTHDVAVLVVCVAGLVAAAGAIALSVDAMLRQDDRTDAAEPYRGPVAALAAVAIATIVLAIALPVEASEAVSTTTPDAAGAAATARAYLASAVLDQNGGAAAGTSRPASRRRWPCSPVRARRAATR